MKPIALFAAGCLLLGSGISTFAQATPKPADAASKAAADGAKPIFDKSDREAFYKRVKEYLDPLDGRTDAKEREGTESEKFKKAEKDVKKAEAALRVYLKNNLSKKYKIDSECLAAVADWQSTITEYLAHKGEFKKGGSSLGSEQQFTLRDEPKSTYTRRLPKLYDPTKKGWPVLLIVQDRGKLSKTITTEEFKSSLLLDGDAETQGMITICVDIPDGAWEDTKKLHKAILTPLKEVRAGFRVDTKRIAIGGIGAGVKAAASAYTRYPFLFSAFVAKGGDPGDVLPENFVNIPFFIAGDAAGFDKEIEGEGGTKIKWSERAKALGIELTTKADGSGDDLAKWMATKTRDCYPPHVMAAVNSDSKYRISVWLMIEPDPAKVARVDGTIDRATNTISVQCDGVTKIFLALSDALVDLEQPVTIKINEQERKLTVPPTFETLIRCYQDYYKGIDMGGVFTSALQAIDVPKKKTPATPPAAPAGENKDKTGEKGGGEKGPEKGGE